MLLTAGVSVSRPWWPCYPDCPCTTLVSSARSATLIRVPGRRSGQVKKLYIGNLPFSATEDQLHEWFSQIGVTPSGVNLIRDRFTGQSRGFAFEWRGPRGTECPAWLRRCPMPLAWRRARAIWVETPGSNRERVVRKYRACLYVARSPESQVCRRQSAGGTAEAWRWPQLPANSAKFAKPLGRDCRQ